MGEVAVNRVTPFVYSMRLAWMSTYVESGEALLWLGSMAAVPERRRALQAWRTDRQGCARHTDDARREGLASDGHAEATAAGRGAAHPCPVRNRESHTLVDVREKPKALPKPGSYKNHRATAWYTSGGHCCACQKLAERLGYMVNIYEGERNWKPVWVRHMPTVMPDHWMHVNGDACVPKRRTACLDCSKRLRRPVWLCPECHESHEIWDHEMAKPASHRVTVG